MAFPSAAIVCLNAAPHVCVFAGYDVTMADLNNASHPKYIGKWATDLVPTEAYTIFDDNTVTGLPVGYIDGCWTRWGGQPWAMYVPADAALAAEIAEKVARVTALAALTYATYRGATLPDPALYRYGDIAVYQDYVYRKMASAWLQLFSNKTTYAIATAVPGIPVVRPTTGNEIGDCFISTTGVIEVCVGLPNVWTLVGSGLYPALSQYPVLSPGGVFSAGPTLKDPSSVLHNTVTTTYVVSTAFVNKPIDFNICFTASTLSMITSVINVKAYILAGATQIGSQMWLAVNSNGGNYHFSGKVRGYLAAGTYTITLCLQGDSGNSVTYTNMSVSIAGVAR
jgi:hypothetical protein